MRIQELKDVLVLVDELPREKQLSCVRLLTYIVNDWEAQTAEGVGREEWWRIRDERSAENTRLVLKKLNTVLERLEKRSGRG